MKLFNPVLVGLVLLSWNTVFAQEAVIRKNINARLPDFPKIDEVRKTPMPGLFELRVNGVDLYYTDAGGNYLIEGSLMETKTRRNLTDERIDKLTTLNFSDLPLKDAFEVVRGNGQRQLAIFVDPNCGYCKRFERELQNVNNVTLHMFLYPILSADSYDKAKAIWCSPDKAKLWQEHMLRNQSLAGIDSSCDTNALARNLAFGKSRHIDGTPTLFLANGKRIPGAPSAQQLEIALKKVKS